MWSLQKRMVNFIPRVKLNQPSLLDVHRDLSIKTILVAIQDIISPVTGKPNKTFFQIKEAGGVHAFLDFHGTIILSTIMKDKLLRLLKVGDCAEIIKALKPDFCLTPDCETYEGEVYKKIVDGEKITFFDGYDVSKKNIQEACEKTLQFMDLCPDQKFIGLVKGSTREQVIEHTHFLRSLGISRMALHIGDFFRNGSPTMISRAKLYAELIRKVTGNLMLIGLGTPRRLLEFSFADSYVSFNHFVTARYGKMFFGHQKVEYESGYRPAIVRQNLIQMMRNIRKLDFQKKLIVGGDCEWEVVPQVNELYIQAMPEKEATTQH